MREILKQNSKYILVAFLIWVIFGPIIFMNRDAIFDWYSNALSSKKYNPKTMNSFISKGDSYLANHFLDDNAKDERKFLNNIQPHLDKMAEACEYFKEAGYRDDILEGTKWYEKNTKWVKNNLDRDSQTADKINSLSRLPISDSEEPGTYWKKNIEPVLNALNFYKRALIYSGPENKAAMRIDMVAKASCRGQESIIGFTTYIYSSEEYLSKIVYKESGRDILGLDDKSKLSQVWVKIRTAEKGTLPKLQEYLVSIQKLLSDTKFAKLAPEEANELYDRLLFILGGTQDPKQLKNEKRLNFKKGMLLFELAESKPSFYEKAIEQFRAAARYPDLEKFTSAEIYEIQSNRFESQLMEAKCYFKKGEFKKAFEILSGMSTRIVDGRENTNKVIEIDLLRNYNILKRETLIKLGRIREADEIITGYE